MERKGKRKKNVDDEMKQNDESNSIYPLIAWRIDTWCEKKDDDETRENKNKKERE